MSSTRVEGASVSSTYPQEADGSQTAFLDGNQPDRLCAPMVESIERKGGHVYMNKPLERIDVEADGSVEKLVLRGGEEVVADEYVSAMPVDVLKRMVPEEWSTMPYFRQLDELEGIPVMNLQLWFDRPFKTSLDGLAFSRSPLLSVYARPPRPVSNDASTRLGEALTPRHAPGEALTPRRASGSFRRRPTWPSAARSTRATRRCWNWFLRR